MTRMASVMAAGVSSSASVRVNRPSYSAVPTIAPSTPSPTRPIRARRSSSSVMPPLATTGRSVSAQTSLSSWRLGPCSMPSLATSVTTYLAQPSASSRASTS